MAGHRMELSDSCLKVDEISERKIISDTSVKISHGEGEKEDVPIDSYSSPVKRYPMYDLLFLRNAQQSVHYPQCALRPKLQALSIWTCRLRCELQYLGLWKITNMGNQYGNCSCNGSCQSYACDSQAYQASNSSVGSGYSQICNEHVQPLQTSASPTLGIKKATRSRERFLNYQRSINSELIRAKSPIVGGKVTLLHHSNQGKPAFIDHRSISSSHLMPAFVKRRMGHANTLQGISDSGVQYNGNGANNAEQLCNDDGVSEHSSRFETPIQARKELIKMANNQRNNSNNNNKGRNSI